MSKKKTIGPKWQEDHYRKALKALRASGLFRGLEGADGYDLRKPLSPSRKGVIRKLAMQMAHIQARPHVLVTPKSRSVERQFKKALGIHSGKLKKIPIPVIPGEKVSVRLGEGNRIFVRYERLGLEQVVCPLDFKTIAANIDYSMEEADQRDTLAQEYFRAAVDAVRPVDDGDSFFRVNSSAGDINPERYASTQFLEDLETYFERLVNRYSEANKAGEVQMLDFITGISVWRKTGPKPWKRAEMNAAATDYTRPLRVIVTPSGIKVKQGKRPAVARGRKGKKK